MNFNLITTAACLVKRFLPRTSGQVSPTWADELPGPCGNADPNIMDFMVEPALNAFVETGGTFPFIASVLKSDGSRTVVTTEATWWTSDSNAATIGEHTGIATGVLEADPYGNCNTSSITVHANYQGYSASAPLEVRSLCESAYLDLVVAIDRSRSMGVIGRSGMTGIELAKLAVQNLANNLRPTRDQIGLVTYAGKLIFHNDIQWADESDATLDCPLTSDPDVLLGAIDNISVRHPSTVEYGKIRIENNHTGIGSGIAKASSELQSGRARADARQVVLIVTDGIENVIQPAYNVASASAIALNQTVIFIGVNVPSAFASGLTASATDSMAYSVSTPENMIGVLAAIPSLIARQINQYCYGYGYTETETPVYGFIW